MILVTGSSGHLGEALVRVLVRDGFAVRGVDIVPSPETHVLGTIYDREVVDECMRGVEAVVHTATLHKPHVTSHDKGRFVDTNVIGTLNLLEAAVRHDVRKFVFTSTTSTFGNAMQPGRSGEAVWVTEELRPDPKNIYGVTKTAAEDLCQLFHQEHGLPCIVLRTSRFFPEEDDMKHTMADYSDENIKANEYLYRRVDIEDVVEAHRLALEHAARIGFARYIVSATTPFSQGDLGELSKNAPKVVARYFPEYERAYSQRGWRMFPKIERVYVNEKARNELGWQPRYDFGYVIERLLKGESPESTLAQAIGSKGYHRVASA